MQMIGHPYVDAIQKGIQCLRMASRWNISSSPIPFHRERVSSLRTEFADLYPEELELIVGAAGSSGYLHGLITKDPEFVRTAFGSNPHELFRNVLIDCKKANGEDVAAVLRGAKKKVALTTALADLGGVWSLSEVTESLSEFADLAVELSSKIGVIRQAKRGKIPGITVDMAQENSAGFVVLAMGKLGAGELNYSSDIDLICLFDESQYDPDDRGQARSALVHATRDMVRILSDNTEAGYVFRTDLRLRPDPSVTPVCLSMDAAERYYESLGRTWERAAYIKARTAAGDIDAGNAFLDRIKPFVWRKHLDFAALEDAHNMRKQIRDHKKTGGPFKLTGHDVKLGQGGIREIEFFAQTQQIILGGRNENLRSRRTMDALSSLSNGDWISQEVCKILQADYVELRNLEHRIQMIQDAQTHSLPTTDDGFRQVANLHGTDDLAGFKNQLSTLFERVEGVTGSYLSPAEEEQTEISDDEQDILDRWRRMPAFRSVRAQEKLTKIFPVIIEKLSQSSDYNEAVGAFENFLAGLPAGVQLFSLFESNAHLVSLIVDVVSISSTLAEHLSRNAQVLDAVLDGGFFADWPSRSELIEIFEKAISDSADYEAKLDAARRVKKEWHFRIGVHHIRGIISTEEAGTQYGDLAEACVRSLWPVVVAHFEKRHGAFENGEATVLAMGSMGVGRLSSSSDLDLLVVYDSGNSDMSDGEKSLAVTTYYGRLTKALVAALSAPMAEGKLYEVDMRLRPSGRKGPVATSFAAFTEYQLNEAWGWEHLSLTRARPLIDSSKLSKRIEDFRKELLLQKADPTYALKTLMDMRFRLNDGQDHPDIWSPKRGAGGLQDIELFGQAAALAVGSAVRSTLDQLTHASELGWTSLEELNMLQRFYDLTWSTVVAQRLLSVGEINWNTLGRAGQAFLIASASQSGIDAHAQALKESRDSAKSIIDRVCSMVKEKNEKLRSE